MGDIAEGILNGDFDEVTGEYIGEGDGYPRTFTRRVKKDKKVYDPPAGIVEAFNNCTFRNIQDGWQVKHEGKTITFYPGPLKYNFRGNWGIYTKKTIGVLIISLFGFNTVKAPEQPAVVNNVQKAIDHILAKAAKIGTAKGADNATATMLKTVAAELEQFL